jgi:hypothetical protein
MGLRQQTNTKKNKETTREEKRDRNKPRDDVVG